MEFHEALHPTGSRGLPWDPSPVTAWPTSSAAYSPYPICDETFPTYYPFDFSPSFPQESYSYGITTSTQLPCDAHELQQQSRKRRRLDTGPSIAQPRHEPPLPMAPHIGKGDDVKGEHHHAQLPIRNSEHSAAGESSSRRMVDFSSLSALLCPCCGFGWGQSDSYQRVPEAPPVYYGPERPYDVEKPPSMQYSTNESQNARVKSMEHHFPPYKDQPDDVASPTKGQAAASPLSDNGETKHAAYPCYQNRGGSQQMLRQSEQAYLSSRSPQGDDSPPPPFSASLLSSAPPHVQDDGPATTAYSHQYPSVPPRSMQNGAIPDSRNDVSRHEQQPNFDILQPNNQRGGKRGPFTDPALREQTAQTRKMGSCIRCRMQRIRCEHNSQEPNGPCLTCKKVVSTKASRFPCLRYKITDVKLYKPGQVPGFEWTRRWNNNVSDQIQTWASDEIKIIRINEGYSDHFLELHVREFVPQAGDKLCRSWSHQGQKKSVEIPPYALVDLEAGKAAYERHIEKALTQTCNNLFASKPHNLLYRTYMQMLQLCKLPASTEDERQARTLLQETFKLWMSVRLTTKSVFITGPEKLGMRPDILDKTSPTPNEIPLPPVMGAQLDLILIHHIQNKLRRQVLERLERMVSKRKHNTWMVTYLVTFVLLHNTSLITAHDAGYALKHNMPRRFAREEKVREYHLGANILLAHFHYCNKGVHPFSDECKDSDLRTLAGLTEEQIQFIHQTRTYVKQNRKIWEDIRKKELYEDDFFFLSQLFEENWQPLHTI